MKVSIELQSNESKKLDGVVTKRDIQRNIDVLDRLIGKVSAHDMIMLIDTKSILEGIKEQLPND